MPPRVSNKSERRLAMLLLLVVERRKDTSREKG